MLENYTLKKGLTRLHACSYPQASSLKSQLHNVVSAVYSKFSITIYSKMLSTVYITTYNSVQYIVEHTVECTIQ